MQSKAIKIHHPTINNEQVDRLSSLPDDVILHILAFLQAQDAIRTTILSKRYADLWTNLPSLAFNNCTTAFVNKTLMLHNKSSIHNFTLRHNYRVHEVDKWIELISLVKVKEVSLNIVDYSFKKYSLKEHIFNNQSLRILKLVFCDIKPPEGLNVIKWHSLRTLHLKHSTLSDQCLSRLLEGSPLLEKLKLRNCLGLQKLSITNKCLKRLSICNLMCDQIIAPNLQCLTISGTIYVKKMRILNAESLIRVQLNLKGRIVSEDVAVDMIRGLLQDVSNVDDVIIGQWCKQLLSQWTLSMIDDID